MTSYVFGHLTLSPWIYPPRPPTPAKNRRITSPNSTRLCTLGTQLLNSVETRSHEGSAPAVVNEMNCLIAGGVKELLACSESVCEIALKLV